MVTMTMTTDQAAVRRVMRRVDRAGDKAGRRFVSVALTEVQNRGRDNAPVGPTKAQYVSELKTGKTKRRDFQTGDLTNAISQEATGDRTQGKVYVPDNVRAGAYAERIHDHKGTKWFKRGPGTRHKGPQADHKYLDRALTGYERTGEMMRDAEAAVAWALARQMR